MHKRILFFIFLLALFLRLYKLGSLPAGFHADEVRVGWNAYSIYKTGLDDRGNRLALYYNTFGDYRPTGIFYLTIPSVAIFGINEFAVRFPSSFLGALTVFPIYYFVLQISKDKKIALSSSLVLALSIWHISVSRATSEVVISMFFALYGLFFFVKAINQKQKKYTYYSTGLLLVSYLFYHSVRILAPIFLLILIIYYWKKLTSVHLTKQAFHSLIILTSVTAILSLSSNATARLSQVSVFNNSADKFNSLVLEYSKYFSINFFLDHDTKPIRYSTPDTGLITYSGFALLLIGIFIAVKYKYSKLPLYLLLASVIPAALTNEDSPNLHRSLFMIAFIPILISYAIDYLKKGNTWKKLFLSFLTIFFIFSFINFGRSYKNADIKIATWRNYSAKQMVLLLNELHSNYDQAIVTNDPDDPYPWFAFYNHKNPNEFNQYAIKRSYGPWQYQNITFSQSECPSRDIFPDRLHDPLEKNVLVIDGFKCPVESKIKDGMQAKVLLQLKNPDDTVAYTFWVKE